jgi:hypothetical protein
VYKQIYSERHHPQFDVIEEGVPKETERAVGKYNVLTELELVGCCNVQGKEP